MQTTYIQFFFPASSSRGKKLSNSININHLIILFFFQGCRLRILPQSKPNLPIYNAFLPQENIVQIILVATINKVNDF